MTGAPLLAVEIAQRRIKDDQAEPLPMQGLPPAAPPSTDHVNGHLGISPGSTTARTAINGLLSPRYKHSLYTAGPRPEPAGDHVMATHWRQMTDETKRTLAYGAGRDNRDANSPNNTLALCGLMRTIVALAGAHVNQ